MEARGIELLIVTDPSNMAWLTGYDGWSFYVHQAVIVPPAGDPIWFGRGMDAAGAERTVWMSDADDRRLSRRLRAVDRAPPDGLPGRNPGRPRPRQAPDRRRDGQLLVLRRRLRLAPAPPAERALHRCHRPRELATRGQEPGRDRRRCARPPASSRRCMPASPRPQGSACASATSSPRSTTPALRGADGVGGDYPAIVPMLPSGPDAAAPHLTWDDRPLRAGEGTFFEIAGCVERYHCPLSRTLFLGRPPQAFRDAETATLEGMEAGLAAARPGNTCEDIAARLFRRPRPAWHRQGQPHRLLDRPLLPARLGRAHHEPAPRRPHRAPPRHDLAFHDRSLAREHGPRDHREHPDHRDRRRVPGGRSPQTARVD